MRAADALLALSITIAAAAQPHRDPTAVLSQAREKLLDRRDRIDNYMCVETVNRSYLKSSRSRSAAPDCDRIMGDKKTGKYKLELEATDRLRLDVKVSEGHEIGAWAGARKFDSRPIVDFIRQGPFGTGRMKSTIGRESNLRAPAS